MVGTARQTDPNAPASACLEHPQSLDGTDFTSGDVKIEQWADLYMNWILDDPGDQYHGFTAEPLGDARRQYMLEQFYWLVTGKILP